MSLRNDKKAKVNLALNTANLQFNLEELKKTLHFFKTAGPVAGGLVDPEDCSNISGIFDVVWYSPLPLNAV